MKLIPLPAFDDYYIWMLRDGHRALVVDPGDAKPVLAALQSEGLQLLGILVAHCHPDHTGGIDVSLDATGASVFGPANERVPDHTAGYIAYFVEVSSEAPVLFCGDTFFSSACGRLLEGTPQQMLVSLGLPAELPGATRVCCAHEYTMNNLEICGPSRTRQPATRSLPGPMTGAARAKPSHPALHH